MPTRIARTATVAVPGADARPWPDLGIVPARAPAPPPWDPAAADQSLLELRARLGPLSAELADAAHAANVSRAWTPFGFARASDFVRETWGRSSRWFSDLAALGRAMQASPTLRAAVAGTDGAAPLGRVAALLVARRPVDTAQDAKTEAEWIALARTLTVRELRAYLRDLRCRGGPRCEPEDAEEADIMAHEICLSAPRLVAAAFEEALDLHRAVSGYAASRESFLEALGAEAAAGPWPPDATCEPPQPRATQAQVEERYDRLRDEMTSADVLHQVNGDPDAAVRPTTDPVAPDASPKLTSSADVLLPRADSEQHARMAVDRLASLVGAEEDIERRVGRVLHEMNQRGAWKALGFASLGHYAVERLGMARRTAESRAGMLRASLAVPEVSAAYDAGVLGLEAAWLVRRILKSAPPPVDRGAQDRWIQHALHVTIKRMRQELRRVHLRVIEHPRDDSIPRPATDAEWFKSLRREPGMTRERLRTLDIGILTEKISSCADVLLRFHAAPEIATAFLAAVESARRNAAGAALDAGRSSTAPASVRAAGLFLTRKEQPPCWVGLLALLEDYAETHDDPRAFPKRRWDAIYSRDGWQCAAPGCTSRCRMDDHHVVYRSDQGSNEAVNQITLCRFHHQQGEHGRYARVRGRAPLDLVWRLGTQALLALYQNERRLPNAPLGIRALSTP